MPTSTPVEVFTDWLSSRPRDARVAIAIDADRLVCESGLLGRNTIVDKNGREWQLAVFRGDELAFRLRFRKVSAYPSTVVVLTRGEGSDGKIEVSLLTDILARNEGGPPLDLSLPAFFKKLCPKINFPPTELRRHRRFAADIQLQNPSTQLTGLQIFSPETPLTEMEPLALRVAAALHADPKVWSVVEALAELFLTPRRLERVMELLPMANRKPETLAAAIRRPGVAPVILKQYLHVLLLSFFQQPTGLSLSWAADLAHHPLVREAADTFSPRARECQAALLFLVTVQRVEGRLAQTPPRFPHPDTLLDWYVNSGHHRLEIDVAQALHYLEGCENEEIAQTGLRYLFGEADDLDPSPLSLKGRVRSRLDTLDHTLAEFVRRDVEAFTQEPRSALTLVKERIGHVAEQIKTGASAGRVWVLLFDGMRFDMWEIVVQPILAEYFSIEGKPYFCVLPSYAQMARTSLFAGCPAPKWRGYKEARTTDEATLVARNLGLTQQEAKTKLRLVTEADTIKARRTMGFADTAAKAINVLIYPIADECHEFRGDLTAFNNKIRTEILGDKAQGVRGILDDLLRRVRPEDTVLATSDHGFIELLSSDGVPVTYAEAERAGRTLQDDVRFRYAKGFRPARGGDVVEVPGIPDPYFVAVGRGWFRREKSTNDPRYQHGGLSLAEMVIPGAVLKRVTEKEARAEIIGIPPGAISVEEDGQTNVSR